MKKSVEIHRLTPSAFSEAGPKSLNHTYNEEWKHAIPYDRWYKNALDTVKVMNRDLHFDSPTQATRALEGLREKFNQAKAESLELHNNRLLKDKHNSPFKYEE